MQGLALYGRADHLLDTPVALTVKERCEMTVRAFYLLMVFLPFLCLGPLLLFLASMVAGKSPPPRQRGTSPADCSHNLVAVVRSLHAI